MMMIQLLHPWVASSPGQFFTNVTRVKNQPGDEANPWGKRLGTRLTRFPETWAHEKNMHAL